MDENNSVLPERKSKNERKQKKRKHNSSNSKRLDQSKETANNCSRDTKRNLEEEEIDNELIQYQPPTKKAKLDTKQMESNLNDLNEAFGEMLSQADSLAATGDMSKKEVKTLKKTFEKMIKRVTKSIKKYEKPTSNANEKDSYEHVKTTSNEREENSQKAKVTKDKKISDSIEESECAVEILTQPSISEIKSKSKDQFTRKVDKEIESKEVQTYKLEPIYLPASKNTCSEVLLDWHDRCEFILKQLASAKEKKQELKIYKKDKWSKHRPAVLANFRGSLIKLMDDIVEADSNLKEIEVDLVCRNLFQDLEWYD